MQKSKGKKKVVSEEGLTSVAITPGTTFMVDLTQSITYFVCQKLASRKYRNVLFEVSDGTVKVCVVLILRCWLTGHDLG